MSYSLGILKYQGKRIYDLINDSMDNHKIFDESCNTILDWTPWYMPEYCDISDNSEVAVDEVSEEEATEILKKLKELI